MIMEPIIEEFGKWRHKPSNTIKKLYSQIDEFGIAPFYYVGNEQCFVDISEWEQV